jgi:hypothetical protein
MVTKTHQDRDSGKASWTLSGLAPVGVAFLPFTPGFSYPSPASPSFTLSHLCDSCL